MSLENAPLDAPLTDVVERTPSLRRAYVLFMDIIGFSRLKTAQQVAAQKELSRMVQEIPEVVAARSDRDNFIARPTGDGMALLFFKDLLSPLRCALQIHQHLKYNAAEIKQTVGAEFKMRMGIHAGEVTLVEDMNRNMDAAGEGIITAQRVMDLGDEDHILLSSEVAKVLKGIEPWANYLTDLGEVRVKHKVVVHVYNLYGRLDGPFCGNPSRPRGVAEDSKNRAKEARAQRPGLGDLLLPYKKPIIAMVLLGGLGYGGYAYNQSTNGGLVKKFDELKASLAPKPGSDSKKNNGKPSKPGKGKTTSARPSGGVVASSGGGGGGGNRKITVPKVVGDDASVAEQALSDSGFNVSRQPVSSKMPADQVVKQSPSSGSKLAPGATVKIWVSKGVEDNTHEGGETGGGDSNGGEEVKPDTGGEKEGGASSSGDSGNE
ncbi:PASTA domain-containing protein [Armatimonas rosea]|uniref:Class 3 adenylate cyclase n=1 Tax=Armatimonas rosea TaxID=685828 RepID=A0A7W9SR37_ARMRO|nr:PASTA domain-containing protein [Armatimonas rosea]MBB6051282.1 class 3 adenylate cyclase [Armatimonas rosea]